MDWSILTGAAEVAGFVVAAWVAYKNQLRRAQMAVALLAPPDAWKV